MPFHCHFINPSPLSIVNSFMFFKPNFDFFFFFWLLVSLIRLTFLLVIPRNLGQFVWMMRKQGLHLDLFRFL